MSLFVLLLALATPVSAQTQIADLNVEPTASRTPDPLAAIHRHVERSRAGIEAFTFDHSVFQNDDLGDLPIGVFDSGIGGLTVLEALFAADLFDNDSLRPTPDGIPDFINERFIYLGDQANMPYGNYSKAGKVDYLRELILKDAIFLLGKRYRESPMDAPRLDKPPVKAIVIACNTATAFGLADLQAAVERWNLPVIVVGVVDAAARGVMNSDSDGAVGVLATVGTCSSGVYPRTIQNVLGQSGKRMRTVTQFGSVHLAAMIEGQPVENRTLGQQVLDDVRELLETHRDAAKSDQAACVPLNTIVFGCTHFPLIQGEIESALNVLRGNPAFSDLISNQMQYVDPAVWTARQLFVELAKNRIRSDQKNSTPKSNDLFFMSVANPSLANSKVTSQGALTHEYKYGRDTGRMNVEDTLVVPMTKSRLPESGRTLVEQKLPEVWKRMSD